MPKNGIASDPYQSLEALESDESLQFALTANKMCIKALGDPTQSSTYPKLLKVLKDDVRIPFPSKMGVDATGDPILYNLWKDKKNPRGIWRKTTLSSYHSNRTKWTTVLDIDKLANTESTSWQWRGSRVLPRARDPESNGGKQVTRALLSLSSGGKDGVVAIREFDLATQDFVKVQPFELPEGKTHACYKSRDVLLVGTEYGSSSLTKAGYPRKIREWVRGTDIRDAPVVFEGETTDLAVSSYIHDERVRGGGIYEIRNRVLSPGRCKYWIRKVKYEQLLSPRDPKRVALGEPAEFKRLETPEDAEVDFVGNLLVITLRKDWSPESGKKYSQGSIIYVNAHKFIKYGPKDRIYHVLFQSSAKVSCESYVATKKFMVLCISNNLKSKLEFHKLEKDANKLRMVGADKKSQIRSIDIRAVDPYVGDEFWLTATGYTDPCSLNLADASKMDSGDKKIVRKTGSEGYIKRKLISLPDQFSASNLEVLQKVATSQDGTEVPYFVVMKRGTTLNKQNATLLHGYGGFEVSLGPTYTAAIGLAWLEKGGVYVEANVRGGGEFGPRWHQTATREKWHRSLEDFIAVAEALNEQRICKPKTLAVKGGSNGGLLVANLYVKRPDLFGAAHCAIPILDLKRMKSLGAPAQWVDEYGDPDSSDWNQFMKKNSPYHNIDEKQKRFPPILFTTTTSSQPMHPGHSRKMVKRLWDKGAGKKWPVFYYESVGKKNDTDSDCQQSAFVTTLSFDFLLSTLTKNAEKKS